MCADSRPTCLLCGSAMQVVGQRRAQCSNSGCPSGGSLYQCEFCEEYAVTRQMEGLTCHNRNCRMYNTLRKGCPHCDKISLISYRGVDWIRKRAIVEHGYQAVAVRAEWCGGDAEEVHTSVCVSEPGYHINVCRCCSVVRLVYDDVRKRTMSQ